MSTGTLNVKQSLFYSFAGIVFVSGELWREHNQFALATLRRFGLGKSVMEDLIQTEVKSLLKDFESKQQSHFQPKGPIQVCISNVMNGICFGKHFQHDDPRYKVILEKLKIHFTNIGLANLSSYIPALSILPGDLFKVKASIQNAEDIYDFFREFALEHMENYDENNINDFTAAFIHEMKKQEYSKETTTFTCKYAFLRSSKEIVNDKDLTNKPSQNNNLIA